MARRGFGWAALAVAAILVMVACSDSDSDDSTSAAFEGETETTADFESAGEDAMGEESNDEGPVADAAAAESVPGSLAGQAVANSALQPTDIGRDLIFTASIDVVVDDVALAGAEAQRTMQGLGGLLFGQETVTEPRPRSVLVFKVPPRDFAEALERLGRVGTVRDQNVITDDVTDRLVDLASQIRSMEISVERLRGFLEDADTVDTVASLEAELLDRETRLELLRRQERTIEGQVALATITLVLDQRVYEPSVEITQTVYVGHDGGAGCPGLAERTISAKGQLTVCYLVLNTGDRHLSDIEVVDEGLRLRHDDMTLLRGGGRLAPGESATWFRDFDVVNDVVLAASVRTQASDHGPLAARAEPLLVEVSISNAPPGFSDSVGAGVNVVQAMAGVVVVVAGFSLPLLWLPLLALAVVWWVRRRGAMSQDPSDA